MVCDADIDLDEVSREETDLARYERFIEGKKVEAPIRGFEPAEPIHSKLFDFQADIVRWCLRLGCAGIFAPFGLGKTLMLLELARQCCLHTSGRALIVMPLGVRGEFLHDAGLVGISPTFVRRTEEAGERGIFLTNYESVREQKVDPRTFDAVLLDEADILRGMGGTKTFREFMGKLEHGPVRYKFVATATPAPNDFEELLAYAAFLGVMDIGNAKTRFFRRDSEKADNLTLHPHKEAEFWAWVASWSVIISRPSDVDQSYSDARYILPPLNEHWHELATKHSDAGLESDGQAKMFVDSAKGVVDAAKAARRSLNARISKVREIVASLRRDDGTLADQPVIWCDLNDEQDAIEAALADLGVSFASLRGTQDPDERDALITKWKRRELDAFVSKPVMFGAGVNLQQSHTMIFSGISYKAKDIIQAIHRIYRFLQAHPCDVHFVYADAQRATRRELERKRVQHAALVDRMAAIVRKFGLGSRLSPMADIVHRATDVQRREVKTRSCVLVNNDCVRELYEMEANSIDHVITSIPFSTQYEYSPSYRDFGHNTSNAAFWDQMSWVCAEVYRVLKPGRIAAVHVKDRIVPSGLTGLGFQCVYPFHADCIRAFDEAGFGFLGMNTIVTDVVRENNQTYRLSYSEQCKDGTKMGVGTPEYLLLFRKPPTDRSNGYADRPVVKDKREYSLGRWQIDAHAFKRSSGDRLLDPRELEGLPHAQMFKLFRGFSLSNEPYDYEHHVALNDKLAEMRKLPTDFMLLQPQSAHPEVWTDVARMRTLNNAQSAKGREAHLCPLPFDIVDRSIRSFSMKDEVVLDPFGGLGTVAYCAVKQGRRAYSIELSPRYFQDSVSYVRAAESEVSMPTLFDLLGVTEAPTKADEDEVLAEIQTGGE